MGRGYIVGISKPVVTCTKRTKLYKLTHTKEVLLYSPVKPMFSVACSWPSASTMKRPGQRDTWRGWVASV